MNSRPVNEMADFTPTIKGVSPYERLPCPCTPPQEKLKIMVAVASISPSLLTSPHALIEATSLGESFGVCYGGQPCPRQSGPTISRQATDAIVRCTGRITSDTTQSLKATVRPLFSESKRVVLDLTDVNYLDSSGLGAIIGLYVSAKFANCHLKVTYSNESLKKLFSITRLDQLLAEGA
jgi:anti-sigma B factor antagonist